MSRYKDLVAENERLEAVVRRQRDLLADLAVVFPTIKGYSFSARLNGYGFIQYDPLSEYAIGKIHDAAQQLRADAATATQKIRRQVIDELRNIETKKATK